MGSLVAYVRVSTEEQGNSGLGLEAQLAAIRLYCHAQGHATVHVVQEVESAAGKRPQLEAALRAVEAGEYDGIIASRLDRFSRSVVQTDEILSRIQKAGRTLVALDLGVDTSTAARRLVANVLASVAQWERDIISERTKAAIAAKVARGERVGRRRVISDDARVRAQLLRGEGCTYEQIIEKLTEDGLETAGGGPWRKSTVQRLLTQEVI